MGIVEETSVAFKKPHFLEPDFKLRRRSFTEDFAEIERIVE
jgi:hypothetical protein